jgi:hypothetical protein
VFERHRWTGAPSAIPGRDRVVDPRREIVRDRASWADAAAPCCCVGRHADGPSRTGDGRPSPAWSVSASADGRPPRDRWPADQHRPLRRPGHGEHHCCARVMDSERVLASATIWVYGCRGDPRPARATVAPICHRPVTKRLEGRRVPPGGAGPDRPVARVRAHRGSANPEQPSL